jgi:hypothetical protein
LLDTSIDSIILISSDSTSGVLAVSVIPVISVISVASVDLVVLDAVLDVLSTPVLNVLVFDDRLKVFHPFVFWIWD